MGRASWLTVLLLLLVCASYGQPPKVLIQPRASWIEPLQFDKDAVAAQGQESGYYYLLIERQENIKLAESFQRYTYKLTTNEGVQQMSDISVTFDPNYQTLIFHEVTIYRNGIPINKMPTAIRTIQREESMDRFLYDESHTAIINVPDVRAGDIIDYCYTLKGFNPAFKGKQMHAFYAALRVPFEKNVFRLLTPSDVTLNIKNVLTDIQPVISRGKDATEYKWTAERSKAIVIENHAPDWHDPFPRVEISSFNSWQEVSEWGTGLYKVSEKEKAAVKGRVGFISQSSDDETFALDAIRFVQDEIRYLGFENGLNGYVPHSPVKILDQRFGDCKDKSLLLTTILQTRGLKAYPMLVNTTQRHRVRESLPSIFAFDHCVVKLDLDGKSIYIDPTVSNQGGKLADYSFPAYGVGLVLNNAGDLTTISHEHAGYHKEIQTFTIDSIGGGALFEVRTVYSGLDADYERSYFARARLETIQKKYTEYYANQYPDIEMIASIKVEDDRDKNEITTVEQYRIAQFWQPDEEEQGKIYCKVRAIGLESYFNVSKSRQRNSPYALAYPLDKRYEINIVTPEEWRVTPEKKTIETEYYRYNYEVSREGPKITLRMEYKTIADHVPVSALAQFIADHGAMHGDLSYYLTYNPKKLPVAARTTVWPGIAVLVIFLLMASFGALYLFKRFDPTPIYPAAWGQPIGGWLILPAIGLCLSPFLTLWQFYNNPEVITGEGWLRSLDQKNYILFAITMAEHIYNAVIIVFMIVLIFMFFQRRSAVPQLMIYYYAIPAIFLIADVIVIRMYTELDVDEETTKSIVRSSIGAMIWIPYFMQSQRVKRTFVNTFRNNDQDPQSVATVQELQNA